MNDFGLTQEQMETIARVLRPYRKHIGRVGLFGSRALGTFRDNSDIDMVLYGNLEENHIDRLRTLFDESNLPVKVDVNAYGLIDYPPFRQHIDRAVKTLFRAEDLKA